MTTEESGVRGAFVAALILTGNTAAAEDAVLNAIATSGCEAHELLVATAKCAIQLCGDCSSQPRISLNLPPELQRLFLLPSVGRRCFVLRMLMGLTLETTSVVLNLHRNEVNDALYAALADLPRLAGVELRRPQLVIE